MLPLLSALVAGLAVVFAILTVARRRPDLASSPADARLAALKSEFAGNGLEATGFADIVRPVAGGFGKILAGLLPTHLLQRVDTALNAAGRPVTTSRFVLIAAVAGGFIGVMAMAGARSFAGMSPAQAVFIGLAGFACGALLLPMYWLRRHVRERRLAIWRALPDTSDLLTTCVEAGMGIDAAFTRVAQEMPGPLSVEIQIMLQEIAMGRPRPEAMAEVGVRTGVDDLVGMLTAIIQADRTGARLAPVLRAQARYIRTARKLWAEERARKIPAKMTFPIVFLIVPTLFLLILGPLAVDIAYIFVD